MPYYDYECQQCGQFSRFRPFAESSEPAACPTCGEVAKKVFPIVNFRSMRAANRRAWERNERSAHAPHQCSPGCSHRPKRKEVSPPGSRLVGSKKRHSRPWMLGH